MIETIQVKKHQRVLLVGDVHGEFDRLMAALEKNDFNPKKDIVVCTGDLIDRGSQNIECLELVAEPWFKTVRGNHDEMLVQSLAGHTLWHETWMINGGHWYYDLPKVDQMYVRDLAAKVAELPYLIELQFDDQLMLVSHGDFPHDKYVRDEISEHDIQQILWSRDRITKLGAGVEPDSVGVEGVTLAFCGHTPLRKSIRAANVCWIDTGVVFDESKEFDVIVLSHS